MHLPVDEMCFTTLHNYELPGIILHAHIAMSSSI